MLFCQIKCIMTEVSSKFSLKNATDALLPYRYHRIDLAPVKLIILFPCSVVNDKKTVTS